MANRCITVCDSALCSCRPCSCVTSTPNLPETDIRTGRDTNSRNYTVEACSVLLTNNHHDPHAFMVSQKLSWYDLLLTYAYPAWLLLSDPICGANKYSVKQSSWIIASSRMSLSLYIYKGKSKVHPRTGHEGPEGEQKYSSTLSLSRG